MKNSMIYKKALTIAVPMMIQNGITNMVGLVDNLMVGSLGTEAMTGVAIVNQLLFVNNLAIFGGLAGPGIYGAQYYGKGDKKGFQSTVRFKVWICLFCVVIAALLFATQADWLIGLYLKGESQSLNRAATLLFGKEYLAVMIATLVPFAITQVYASSLRETGETMKPMVAGIVSVFVDIIFNYALIFGHFGFPKLGVVGAALATVLARVTECLIVVVWSHMKRKKHLFLVGLYQTFKVPAAQCIQIGKKGLPIFVNEFFWASSMAILTQNYSMKGLSVVAGINISNTICNLFNVSFIALASSVGVILGQYLGGQEFEKAKKASRVLMNFTAGVSLFFGLLLISISGVFPGFYDTTAQVQHMATRFIICTALFFPIQGYINAMYFTLRSGGKTVITFLFDSVFNCLISVPVAFVLCRYTPLPILAIYAVIQALDLIKLVIGGILIRKGVWISNLVE